MRTDIKVPTVHLNGSGRDMLIVNYSNARDALIAAREALQQAAPHARDYYVQSDAMAALTATRQHVERLKKLEELEGEINFILERVIAQRRPANL